jgi:hypothetical protein
MFEKRGLTISSPFPLLMRRLGPPTRPAVRVDARSITEARLKSSFLQEPTEREVAAAMVIDPLSPTAKNLD